MAIKNRSIDNNAKIAAHKLDFRSSNLNSNFVKDGDIRWNETTEVLQYYRGSTWSALAGGGGSDSLNSAYDNGSSITVDNGAVTLTDSQTDTTGGLLITKSGVVTGANSASVFHINSTGAHDTTGTLKLLELSMGAESATTPQGLEITMNADADDAIMLTTGSQTITDGDFTVSAAGRTTTNGFSVTTANTSGDGMIFNIDSLTGGDGVVIDGDATGDSVNYLAIQEGSTNIFTVGDDTCTMEVKQIIDIDHAEAFLIRENGDAADVLTVDTTQDAGDTTMLLTTKVTTGVGMHIDGSTITSGDALKITIVSGTMTAAGAAFAIYDGVTEIFAIRENGDMTSAGSAEGTSVATYTTGDLVITDGDLTISSGELSLTTDDTTSDAVDLILDTITTANGVDLTADGLTTGIGLLLTSTSAALAAGQLLNLDHTVSSATLTAKSGQLIDIVSSRTSTRLSGTTADDYDAFSVIRTAVQNGAGGTLTSTGSVARFENVATQTAGTLTDSTIVLEVVQDVDSSGDAVQITNPHVTGVSLDVVASSTTSAGSVTVTANALTTGTAMLLTSSGTIVTTGDVLSIVANTATTSTGLLRISGTGLTDGFAAELTGGGANVTASGGVLNVTGGASTDGSVLKLTTTGAYTGTVGVIDANAASLTTGVFMDIGLDAMTTGTGILMDALDALTSGIAVSIESGATAITGAGRILRVDHTGVSGSSAILSEFASAAADETVILRVTASAALAAGVALDVTASSMTTGTAIDASDLNALTSGIGLHLASSATAITGAGRLLYSNHTGTTGSTAILNEFASAANDETVVFQVTGSDALAGGKLFNLSAAAVTTGTILDISDNTAHTTGTGINLVTNSADTGTRTLLNVKNDHASATGTTIAAFTQDAPTATNFFKVLAMNSNNVWVGDGTTSPDTALTGTAGDIAINCDSNKAYYCTGTTNWTALA